MSILVWIVFGLIVGFIARAIMPGRQAMGTIATMLLGIAGSLIGGFIASGFGRSGITAVTPVGLIGSVLGALLLLFLAGLFTGPRIGTRV